MPKPSLPASRPSNIKRDPSSAKFRSDSRFDQLSTDPRFRIPSRQSQKLALDPRFKSVLSDSRFTRKARVDRYGRPLSSSAGRRELERFYRLDEGDDVEIDDDDAVSRELRRVEQENEPYDPARQGGYSESSSSEEESGSEAEVESDEEADVRAAAKSVEEGEVTHRLAAVNLDWDNIRAADIFAVAQSFCPSTGRIVEVTVYPSEYGRERMEREQMEGPPKELFLSQSQPQTVSHDQPDMINEADEDEEATKKRLQREQVENPEDFDMNSKALRQYQLTRLRYYYAVITTSSSSIARALYDQMDGREYLSSANFFDLRFVPDSVSFDDPVTDKPRDSCTELTQSYKPNEFRTEALTHSRVRLTWDEEDGSRKEAQKRAFTQDAPDDDDLKAYVGSSNSSSSEEDGDDDPGTNPPPSKINDRKEAARRKTRALLGLTDEPAAVRNKDDAQGDMQITFSSGLGGENRAGGIFANKPEDVREETTREKYVRKERERKARRKEKMKAARRGEKVTGSESVQDVEDEGGGTEKDINANEGREEVSEDDPFNDPFFLDPAAANEGARKEAKKKKKRHEAELSAKEKEQRNEERANLQRLMDDDADNTRPSNSTAARDSHFDMAAIRRAEKRAKNPKKRKHHAADDGAERMDGFKPDLGDERFKGLFESNDFAIDPTNPRFSGTKAMKQILEEGRRKRDNAAGQEGAKVNEAGTGRRNGAAGELDGLVAKLKRPRVAT